MKALSHESTALYDVPGPNTERRHKLYGLLSTPALLALVGWILHLLFDTDQFTETKWMPFEYEDHPVRRVATLIVEFFRAMPVLVVIFFAFVALKVQPLLALVTGLTLYNGSVLAMLPAIISQLVVALKDTSLGYLITYEEFLHAGKLIASNLDYDLPFIPVVLVISPIYIGMCMLLSWFAQWVSKRQRRNPKTEAVEVAPAEPGTLLPGPQ
ncbi:amino acid ABC transporter permease [Streptomyces sp. NPDC021622]|uniref:amino acid ABC transporter permease n=1 Tax=Streptomyces sp. NPDC021622 TaxID=3155013 RepID=UPI0033D2D372